MNALAAGLVVLLGATAFASKGWVQDRRVNQDEATKMAEKVSSKEFPIVVNDEVLTQLNLYVGTKEGREFMKKSLERMQEHKSVVKEAIEKHKLPPAIMGVALAESGFENTPQKMNSRNQSAGVWQFIPSTARKFGLTVNASVDERLDIPKSSDAAVRYLKANHALFNDWPLAVLAYNMGEGSLRKAIDKKGTNDVWTLIRAGHQGDKDYLAKVMAAMIVIGSPEIVE